MVKIRPVSSCPAATLPTALAAVVPGVPGLPLPPMASDSCLYFWEQGDTTVEGQAAHAVQEAGEEPGLWVLHDAQRREPSCSCICVLCMSGRSRVLNARWGEFRLPVLQGRGQGGEAGLCTWQGGAGLCAQQGRETRGAASTMCNP